MIENRWRGVLHAYLITLAVIVTAMFWAFAWILLINPGTFLKSHVELYLACNALSVIGIAIATVRCSSSNPRYFLTGRKAARVACEQAAWAGLLMFLVLFAAKGSAVSRVFLFGFLGSLLLVLAALNYWLPKVLGDFFFGARHTERALLMGEDAAVQESLFRMQSLESCGLKLTGLLADDERWANHPSGVPYLGATAALERVLKRKKIGQVVYLGIPPDMKKLRWIKSVAEKCGCRLMLYNNVCDLLRFPVSSFNYDGMEFFSFRQEPLQNPVNRGVKRLIDIGVALPVVALLMPPLCAVVWMLHRLQSPGPLFYRQLRAGVQNRPFYVWKFRTLHARKHNAVQQVAQNDERVFAAGRVLRRLSLDEIPQFLNVLTGDMSIIGPRPHMLKHNKLFARVMEAYNVRCLVKPGITGLAQVSGYRGEAKTEQDIVKRVEKDIEYIERWSFWLDVNLFFRTALQVFRPPKTAY